MGRLGTLSILAAWLLGAAAEDARALELEALGRFQIAGTTTGTAARDEAWTVHYLVPDVRRPKAPVILLPSYDLTAYIYQATPDGREGWVHALARNGYSVYAVESVLADVDPTRAQAADERQNERPVALSFADLWARWGFGGAPGQPYGNVRFPVHAVDQVYASLPRTMYDRGVASGPNASVERDDPRLGNLLALLGRIGPAILLAHGESAALALRAAAIRPSSVRGLVTVEASGCARPATELDGISSIPFLAVFGDYIQARQQHDNLEACRALAAVLSERRGGRGDMLVLPEESVFGNTYLLMQDDNNAQVAGQIIRWMDRRVD